MAQNKILNVEPQYVASAAGNLLNPNVTAVTGPVGFTMTQPYLIIKHVRITNSDSSPHTVSLYKGATAGHAGGTEVFFPAAYSLAGNQYQDWVGQLRVDSADFITGSSDVSNKVTITFDCEIGVS